MVSEERWKTRRADDVWFSFDMDVLPSEKVAPVDSYRGGLAADETGGFDIDVVVRMVLLDCLMCGIDGCHGIYNDGTEDLWLFFTNQHCPVLPVGARWTTTTTTSPVTR